MAALGAFDFHLGQGPDLLLFSADDDNVLFLGFHRLNASFGFSGLVFATWAAQDDRLGLLYGYKP